jgi:hypothetical protein
MGKLLLDLVMLPFKLALFLLELLGRTVAIVVGLVFVGIGALLCLLGPLVIIGAPLCLIGAILVIKAV